MHSMIRGCIVLASVFAALAENRSLLAVAESEALAENRSLLALAAERGHKGHCYASGDPHFVTFDGVRHDPVFSPRAWWLVHTSTDKFNIQGTYSQCGTRTGGGWQGWRPNKKSSAHCFESMALGGTLTNDKVLVVRPPCTWNWGKIGCNDCSADKLPRFYWNGKEVKCKLNAWVKVAPKMEVHCHPHKAQVKFDGGRVTAMLSYFGFGGKGCNGGKTHANIHVWMHKGDFGKQCGHCGSFNGNALDDRIYKQYDGKLIKKAAPLCYPQVEDCVSMFPPSMVPRSYHATGKQVPRDNDDAGMCGCSPQNRCRGGDGKMNVEKACQDAYKKVCGTLADPRDAKHKDFFEDCVEDTCLGGADFIDVDVGEEGGKNCKETEAMNDDAVCGHCKA